MSRSHRAILLLSWTTVLLSLVCGRLREFDNSDLLVPVFCSTGQWTPFYFGENRFGMLVAGLCGFIHAPLVNLTAQLTIGGAAGLACFWLLPYCFPVRCRLLWTNLMLLLCLSTYEPSTVNILFTSGQPYGVALALALAGLALGQRGSWRLSFCAFALAFWVNLGAAPTLLCLSLWHERGQRRQALLNTALMLLTFLLWLRGVNYFPWANPVQTELRIPDAQACSRIVHSLTRAVDCGLVGALALGIGLGWREWRLSLHLWGVVLIAILQFAAMRWVDMSQFDSRYFCYGYFFAMAALALPLASWLEEISAAAPVVAGVTATVVALGKLGIGDVRDSYATLLRPCRPIYVEAKKLEAEFWAGEYWSSWILALIDGCERYPLPALAPITYRCESCPTLWQPAIREGRVIAIENCYYREFWSHLRGFPGSPGRWLTVARSPRLVLARWGQDEDLKSPLRAILDRPSASMSGAQLYPVLGVGWQIEPGEIVSVGSQLELILPGAPAAEVTLQAEVPTRCRLWCGGGDPRELTLAAGLSTTTVELGPKAPPAGRSTSWNLPTPSFAWLA